MLKILQAGLQQHMNCELPDVQSGFRKGGGTSDQIARIHWIREKAKEFQKKKPTSASLTMLKSLCGSQQTVANSSRDGNTRPPYLLLRNMYADQEAIVRTGHGTMDWFQIEKGVCQGCILSPCLFHLYAEYIIYQGLP